MLQGLRGSFVSMVTACCLVGSLGLPRGFADDVKPEDTLLQLTRMMQQAELQMRAGNLTAETQQLQQQVIDQLDAWIAAFESQQQQGQQQQGQQQQGQQQREGEAEQGEEEPSRSEQGGDRKEAPGDGEESGDAAEEGTEAGMGDRGEEGVAGSQRESPTASRARDGVWGHLPDRIRQQLQSAAVERFLPKYEDLIEAYYQRLAEEEARPALPRIP